MDKMNLIIYKTKLYNVTRAFLCAFPAYLVVIFFIFFVGHYFLIPFFIPFILFIAFNIIIFSFQNLFKSIFTSKIILEFTDEMFLVNVYNHKDVLIKNYSYDWSDIQSYKVYFSKTDITFLTIYLKGNKSKTFPFKDEKDEETAANENSVFSIFYFYVKEYNKSIANEDSIVVSKGFLNTRNGTITIYVFVVIAVFDILLNIMYKPKDSMLFILMGLFVVIGLLLKRSSDRTLFKSINQKKVRPPSD